MKNQIDLDAILAMLADHAAGQVSDAELEAALMLNAPDNPSPVFSESA